MIVVVGVKGKQKGVEGAIRSGAEAVTKRKSLPFKFQIKTLLMSLFPPWFISYFFIHSTA